MKSKLIFFPGLGADSRLFFNQKKVFKNSIVPPWLPPQRNETLSQYSRRWSKFLKLKKGCILVGVSFGGMVALEMAKWVKPKAVLLVGSCRTPVSVPLILRVMGSYPGWPIIAKSLAKTFPFGRGWFLGVEKRDQLDLLMDMFLKTPNSFLRWTVNAIRGWDGVELNVAPTYHIHGSRDRLIPCRNVKPDFVIEGGGHTIILTHPREIKEFIEKWA